MAKTAVEAPATSPRASRTPVNEFGRMRALFRSQKTYAITSSAKDLLKANPRSGSWRKVTRASGNATSDTASKASHQRRASITCGRSRWRGWRLAAVSLHFRCGTGELKLPRYFRCRSVTILRWNFGEEKERGGLVARALMLRVVVDQRRAAAFFFAGTFALLAPLREALEAVLPPFASAALHTVSVISRVTTYGSMLAFGRRSSM